MSDIRCGTCAFLVVPPNKAGARATQANKTYVCRYVVMEIALPESVMSYLGRQGLRGTHELPRERMLHDGGLGCPVWEKYRRADTAS